MSRFPLIPNFSVEQHQPHKTMKIANRFSLFWLTLYRAETNAYDSPHNISSNNYDWKTFVEWCVQMENSNIVYERLRFHSLQRTVYSMTSTNIQRDIINAYRREFSDTLGKKHLNPKQKQEKESIELMELINDALDQQIEYQLSSQAIKYSIRDKMYCDAQQQTLLKLFDINIHTANVFFVHSIYAANL